MPNIRLVGGPFNNTERTVDQLAPKHKFKLVLQHPKGVEQSTQADEVLIVEYKQKRNYTYQYVQPDLSTMDRKGLLNHIKVLEATISFMNAGITRNR